MTDFLKDFLINCEALAQQEQQFRQTIQSRLEQPDRLRTFMQLMIVVRESCAALKALDSKHFLDKLKTELQERSELALKEIEQLENNTKNQVEALNTEITALQQKLKARQDVTDDVVKGLGIVGNEEELSQLTSQAETLYANIEKRLADMVALRNSQTYAQLLNTIAVTPQT